MVYFRLTTSSIEDKVEMFKDNMWVLYSDRVVENAKMHRVGEK